MSDSLYMQRCLELARLGAGNVSPNPMVGAVLVHDNRIIGEGYHRYYGQAHAEPECISDAHGRLAEMGISSYEIDNTLRQSTLYVSLEPCAHFGKTPPCADLVITKGIPKVVVGCRDPFGEVDGRGIAKLTAAGTEVMFGVLEAECISLNRRFFTFHLKKRPYIILKWAQTADAFMGLNGERLLISNEISNRAVHRWRMEEASILVGTNTALNDNPRLTTRLWPGRNPVRLVIDLHSRLPSSLQVFSDEARTFVFTSDRDGEAGNVSYRKVSTSQSLASEICNALYDLNIQSVLVEGGRQTLQTFIDAGLWDEARVITSNRLWTEGGIAAPQLTHAILHSEQSFLDDTIRFFERQPAE